MAEQGSPCSVVLEGGVTSAVVYASLLARLSRRYRFRQLGGTSSGGVAAAAAAAAEYGRLHAPASAQAFDGLGDFASVLAETDARGRTRLLRLFEPSADTRPALQVALQALDKSGRDGWVSMAGRAALALLANFGATATMLGLVVAASGGLTADAMGGRLDCSLLHPATMAACAGAWLLLLLVMLPTLLAAGVVLLLRALWLTVRALRANHWGLCSGMGSDDALTMTLYGLLQELSGRSVADPPLTFGDIWSFPATERDAEPRRPGARCIDLQIIATALNQSRAVRLPGAAGTNPLQEYFYDPDEWRALFPAPVLRQLAAAAPPVRLVKDDGKPLCAMPGPAHWPLLLAVRLSLSFPLLLSAVPMYVAVPRRERLRRDGDGSLPAFAARKVVFSDGGITSNCPVHLFDVPLPAFPTFGVNLYLRPNDKRTRVTRSDTRDPELEAAAVPDAALWTSPLPFLLQIVRTMLGWRDSLQRGMPGTRERIVHVGLPPHAGGLNLAMSPRTLRRLGRVGVVAAEILRRDFGSPRRLGEPNAWERHRWTRARSTLSALRVYLSTLVERLSVGDPDYHRLLRTATPSQHPLDGDAARRQAAELADGAVALMQRLDAAVDALDRNTPRPPPELRLTPPQ